MDWGLDLPPQVCVLNEELGRKSGFSFNMYICNDLLQPQEVQKNVLKSIINSLLQDLKRYVYRQTLICEAGNLSILFLHIILLNIAHL